MPNTETLPQQLSNAEIPASFSSRMRAGETVDGVYLENLTLPELEEQKLQTIHELLSHHNLDQLIGRGKISFGMIKPHSSEGEGLPEDDDEAAGEILSEIGEKNIIFSLPFKFTRDNAEEFYGHLKDKFADNPNIYREIIDFAASSGLTAVLLYKRDAGLTFDLGEGQMFEGGSTLFPTGKLRTTEGEVQLSDNTVAFIKNRMPVIKSVSNMSEAEMEEFAGRRKYFVEDGQVKVKIENAIVWWRDKMGDTRPEDAKENNPNSIRARHSAKLPNNIVHGSDSIDSVKREVKILDEAVVSLLAKSQQNAMKPNEAILVNE